MSTTIQSLPEEILEKILVNLSPYREYNTAALVCKQWRRIIAGVARKFQKCFEEAFEKNQVVWTEASIEGNFLRNTSFMSPRLLHSMCYNDSTRSVYTFGGLSVGYESAGFNDMWRLDMHTKRWERPIASGNIPQPKFGCSLESFKDHLILYGGRSMPPTAPFPMYRSQSCSNELHIFDTKTNKWMLRRTLQDSPSAIYLHSTCIVTNQSDDDGCMVLFGGIKDSGGGDSNEMWCLDLPEYSWWRPIIVGQLPEPRHMHVQAAIKSEFTFSSSVLIVGGNTIGNRILTDAWMLVRTGFREWTSSKLIIQPGPHDFVPQIHIFKSSAVNVGRSLVFFGSVPANKALPERRKIFRLYPYNDDDSGVLQERKVSPKTYHNPLCMYVLDLSNAFSENVLVWRSPLSKDENVILRSVLGPNRPNRHIAVIGRGEVVIHGDFPLEARQLVERTITQSHNFLQAQATNKWTPLYFISADFT